MYLIPLNCLLKNGIVYLKFEKLDLIVFYSSPHKVIIKAAGANFGR